MRYSNRKEKYKKIQKEGRNLNKKNANIEKHSILRCRERYNQNLNRVDEDKIVAKIISGDCLYVRTDVGSGCEYYYVKHNNVPIKVLYDPMYRFVVTDNYFNTEEYNKLVELKNKEKDSSVLKEDITKGVKKGIKMYNIEKWCDIAGYGSCKINDEVYLKRSDVFLKNILGSNLQQKGYLKGTVLIHKNNFTGYRPINGQAGYKISFVKASELPNILKNEIVQKYPKIKKNILDIMEDLNKPVQKVVDEAIKDLPCANCVPYCINENKLDNKVLLDTFKQQRDAAQQIMNILEENEFLKNKFTGIELDIEKSKKTNDLLNKDLQKTKEMFSSINELNKSLIEENEEIKGGIKEMQELNARILDHNKELLEANKVLLNGNKIQKDANSVLGKCNAEITKENIELIKQIGELKVQLATPQSLIDKIKSLIN